MLNWAGSAGSLPATQRDAAGPAELRRQKRPGRGNKDIKDKQDMKFHEFILDILKIPVKFHLVPCPVVSWRHNPKELK